MGWRSEYDPGIVQVTVLFSTVTIYHKKVSFVKLSTDP